jgi:hypothetical protein
MKNFILILFLLFGGIAHAQRINYFPDSVRIELPDQHAILVIEMRDFSKKPGTLRQVPLLLKETWDAASQALPAAPSGPQKIEARIVPEGLKEIIGWTDASNVKPVGSKTLIRIVPVQERATDITVTDNKIVELLPTGWEMKITSPDVRLWVYADSFEHLKEAVQVDLTAALDKITSEPNFQHLGKNTIQAYIQMRNQRIDQSVLKRKYPGDNIFLTGTAGVGLFRDKIYPQLTLTFGLTFRDHFGRKNIRTSLVWDNMLFTEKPVEGYQLNVNSFLSLSFEKNFNTKTKAPQWIGIGVGLLARKNGDYFKGNTAKIFIIHEMENRRISLQPEFYMTDDFKKFAFGMTMKYTF